MFVRLIIVCVSYEFSQKYNVVTLAVMELLTEDQLIGDVKPNSLVHLRDWPGTYWFWFSRYGFHSLSLLPMMEQAKKNLAHPRLFIEEVIKCCEETIEDQKLREKLKENISKFEKLKQEIRNHGINDKKKKKIRSKINALSPQIELSKALIALCKTQRFILDRLDWCNIDQPMTSNI